MTTFIYALADPVSGKIRYIGKSDKPLRRLYGHNMAPGDGPKGDWIRSLAGRGMQPRCEVIDEVPAVEWQFWEREYIRLYRAINIRLLNATDGGEGAKHTADSERRRVEAIRRAMTPESKRRRSLKMRGVKKSAQAIANMSRPWTDERRANHIARLKSRTLSSATLAKMRAAALGHKRLVGFKHSAEARANMSAAQRGNKNNLGKPMSESTKAKISKGNTGKSRRGWHHTDETKAKLRASKLRRDYEQANRNLH